MFHVDQKSSDDIEPISQQVGEPVIPNVDNTNATIERIDQLLEREKINNKADAWIKLDKPHRTRKLHRFAEMYGNEHTLSANVVCELKNFFVKCLDNNKLSKTKDVIYDRTSGEITAVPALVYNDTNHQFALKITDPKRISTIKSLTPKKKIA
jgi:hypothetical protein